MRDGNHKTDIRNSTTIDKTFVLLSIKTNPDDVDININVNKSTVTKK